MPSSRLFDGHKRVIVGSAGITADLRAVILSVCAGDPTFAFCGHTAAPGVLLRSLVQNNPDIVLMDDGWLNDRSLAALVRLHRALPSARTLLISNSLELETIFRVLRLGVRGVIARTQKEQREHRAMNAVPVRNSHQSRVAAHGVLRNAINAAQKR